jgi:AAA domain
MTAESAGMARLSSRSASTVMPSKPEWLWKGWMLRRALNLIIARQGSGKTTLAAYVVAQLVGGMALPDDQAHEPIRAAVLSLEEPDDRVVARLRAAGADLDRVEILNEVLVTDDGVEVPHRWSLPRDIGVLGDAIRDLQLDLVIVDGLGYSISGDSHNYAVVGSALAALAAEADRTGAAIVGLVHPPKGSSDAVTAAIGSTAWTAIPRVCIVLGTDPNDEGLRVASVAKTNYKMPDSGVAFTIENNPTYECGYIDALIASTVTADEIAAPPTAEEKTAKSEAVEFLREVLADGPMEAEVVTRLAADFSRTTLKRARKMLGVISTRKQGDHGRVAAWEWSLPGGHDQRTTSTGPLDPWSSGPSSSHQEKYPPSLPEDQPRRSGPLDGTLRSDGVARIVELFNGEER